MFFKIQKFPENRFKNVHSSLLQVLKTLKRKIASKMFTVHHRKHWTNANLGQTCEIIIPNFYSWVILGEKSGFTLRVKCSTCNSQYMFPKLDPKLASSAYYIGENLGVNKFFSYLLWDYFKQTLFMGQNWDMLTPTLTVLGCTRLFLGQSWVYFESKFHFS